MPNLNNRNRARGSDATFARLVRRAERRPIVPLRDPLGPLPRQGGRRQSWKRALQDIIAAHNERHATKPKSVSFKTQTERACSLFRCFKDLHALGYKIRNPHCLGGRHIQALVRDWTAAQPRSRRRTLSAAMVQTELSHLRTFASWIGKPGLVRPAESYVEDPARVTRRSAATADKSWPAHGVDPGRVIEDIALHDPWVGAQLRLARAFGLRIKEAVMIQPRLAERLGGDASDASARVGGHLEVARGTKGGRPRRIPIDTPAKRTALDAAKALLTSDAQYLANPTRSLVQNLDRLTNVMKKFGVTRKALGVTPHGLRHEYAGDRYEALTGVPPRVRGGPSIEAATAEQARLHVAEELGHSRPQILAAYCGSPRARTIPHATPSPDATDDAAA